jgi:Mce-associated membrane protein
MRPQFHYTQYQGWINDPAGLGAPDAAPEAHVDDVPEAESGGGQANDAGPSGSTPLLQSPRLTGYLIKALAVLVVVLLLQSGWWLWRWYDTRVDAAGQDAAAGEIVTPSGRPVLMEQYLWQEGVTAAADASRAMFSVDPERYDEEIERAVELMTADYAEEFRATKRDVRASVLESNTEVAIVVTGQGVVRANRSELQALVFLTQVVTRDGDGEGERVNQITPYKLLVDMVHTTEGWLVDGVRTDAERELAEPDGTTVPDGDEEPDNGAEGE